MSSPFSSLDSRIVPSWVLLSEPSDPSPFVPYNPFGIFTVDLGYGSGGYGDLLYGQNVMSEITFTTDWTGQTGPSTNFTTVTARIVPIWVNL